MLDTVRELRQNFIRDVRRALRHEVDSDALRANQFDNLSDFLHQSLWAVRKQQMCFIKEEYHPRLIQVANFRELLIKIRHHPEQEGRINRWTLDQTPGGENIDVSSALFASAHPVADVKFRLTKELLATFFLESKQRTLNCPDTRCRDISVHCGKLRSVIPDELQHCAQILEIQQQQTMIICYTEDNIQNSCLDLR